MRKRTPPEVRFWAKVDKNGPLPERRPELGPCWLWTATTRYGYGQLGRGGRGEGLFMAHRFSYELNVGPIPKGLTIDHLCSRPSCVRPSHLEPVTQRVNNLRGIGPTARKAAQTHCVNGHELAGDNIYRRADRPNVRECLTCHRNHGRQKRRQRGRQVHPDG